MEMKQEADVVFTKEQKYEVEEEFLPNEIWNKQQYNNQTNSTIEESVPIKQENYDDTRVIHLQQTYTNSISKTNQSVDDADIIKCELVPVNNSKQSTIGTEKIMYLDEVRFESSNNRSTGNTSEDPTSINEDVGSDKKIEWSENDTKLLLDLYSEGLPQVGPLKRYKNKKALWQHIGNAIAETLGISRSPTQCETRYKTILKRKGNSMKINKTSGETRVDVDYEQEIEKIKSQDESLRPEVLMCEGSLITNNKRAISPSSDKKTDSVKKACTSRNFPIIKFLKDIHKEKEENKERRHREKMELLKELFKNKNS